MHDFPPNKITQSLKTYKCWLIVAYLRNRFKFQDESVSPRQAEAAAFSLLFIRRPTQFNCKKAEPPSHKRWVEDFMTHL